LRETIFSSLEWLMFKPWEVTQAMRYDDGAWDFGIFEIIQLRVDVPMKIWSPKHQRDNLLDCAISSIVQALRWCSSESERGARKR